MRSEVCRAECGLRPMQVSMKCQMLSLTDKDRIEEVSPNLSRSMSAINYLAVDDWSDIHTELLVPSRFLLLNFVGLSLSRTIQLYFHIQIQRWLLPSRTHWHRNLISWGWLFRWAAQTQKQNIALLVFGCHVIERCDSWEDLSRYVLMHVRVLTRNKFTT